MRGEELRSLVRLVPPHWRISLEGAEEKVRLDAGAFSATIQPHDGRRYSFKIRAENRERPTIYGYGMSLRQAFRAAADLMRSLSPASRVEPARVEPARQRAA